MKLNGSLCAIIELGIFFIISYQLRQYKELSTMHVGAYYWVMFTILTGIWEITYVTQRKRVSHMAKELIDSNERVWSSDYSICVLFPWNFSKIFYAEYAAYADREYMENEDKWSLAIEGSHCLCCAIYSTMTIVFFIHNENSYRFYLSLGAAMGSQLMNSVLYMSEYIIQTRESTNVNYNSDEFPCGILLLKRPFMYINIFWTIMPGGILICYLL